MNKHTRAVAPPLKAEVDSSAQSYDDSIMRVFIKIIAIGSIIAASLGLLARLIIANFT